MYFLKRCTEAKTIACRLAPDTWADKTSVNAIFAGVKGLNLKQMKKTNKQNKTLRKRSFDFKELVLEINLDVV